jgi:hypothetical protein
MISGSKLTRTIQVNKTFWPVSLGEKLWAPLPSWDLKASFEANLLAGFTEECLRAQKLERWWLSSADECLAARGLVVDESSRLKLAKAIGAAVQRASLTLARLARGQGGAQMGKDRAGSPRCAHQGWRLGPERCSRS